MNIYLGSDHAGFEAKEKVFAHLSKLRFNVEDVGDKTLDPKDDYPKYAMFATAKVLGDSNEDPRAILLCGSGQGMCIAANRTPGIRAALVWNNDVARETRHDNDSNVLCLPARFLSDDEVLSIVDTWLQTPFSNEPRHVQRIKEIDEVS